MTLNARSEAALEGVHPDLVAIVRLAHLKLCAPTAAGEGPAGSAARGLIVTEGLRTLARQRQLLAEGRSRTLNSRHLTGHAVDLVDPEASYAPAAMAAIAAAMKAAAAELGYSITWGGDWSTFKDTPHFELSWHDYPADAPAVAGAAKPAGVVDVPPGGKGIKAALARSRTILGAQLAGLGGLIGYFDQAVGVLLDGLGEVTKLGPLLAALDLRSAGLGLTIFGVTLVVLRRLQAAYGGKQG